MDDKIFDQIHDVDLKKTMETSYIDYAMSVIAQRALPDVRDGLNLVNRFRNFKFGHCHGVARDTAVMNM